MAVLGINSRAACFSHFHSKGPAFSFLNYSRHCEIIFFERRRRARMDTENGHRRVTRLRLRIIEAETQGYLTSYLQAPSGTVKYGRGPLEVSGARAEYGTVYG